jgi:16S rRNA (guanine966-N2)-methyltransferase
MSTRASPAASANRPRPRLARGPQVHEVRIIGGQWKRSKLRVADHPGLRPTPDRVRETLFNWLGQDLSGWRCLDAFAGTGVLGFEAASRGAARVLLVEQEGAVLESLTLAKTRLKADAVQVQRGDGVAVLRQSPPGGWDLVFLDPPFAGTLLSPALQAAVQALSATGFIYLESAQRWDEPSLMALGLRLHRHLKAGAVHAHLLQHASTPGVPSP